MSSLKIGYVPLAKASWRDQRLKVVREQSLSLLQGVNPAYSVVGGEDLITTDAEALALLERFENERVDVILLHFITFALGSIVPLLAERSKLPLVLWSMPEPPMEGGRISSNSFCAVNMNAHALWKLKARYLHVHSALEMAAVKLRAALGPVSAVKRLRRTKMAIVGSRAPGFYTSGANEMLLRRQLGVEIENVTLYELVELANKAPKEKVDEAVELLKASANCVCGPKDEELRKGAALYLAFLEVKELYSVDVFSVKCWPEFAQYYGIGVCTILSMLNDRSILAGCEGDVYGTVTMIMENEITGGMPFFCDLISIDGEQNTGVTWHCGAAPKGLRREGAQSSLRLHSIIDGGDKKGLTNEFPLKTGRVTLARVSETRDNDGYRMLITSGVAVETEQILRGNPLRIQFDVPLERIAKTLIYEGFEHHFSVIHGNVEEELLNICRLLDIQPVVLS